MQIFVGSERRLDSINAKAMQIARLARNTAAALLAVSVASVASKIDRVGGDQLAQNFTEVEFISTGAAAQFKQKVFVPAPFASG